MVSHWCGRCGHCTVVSSGESVGETCPSCNKGWNDYKCPKCNEMWDSGKNIDAGDVVNCPKCGTKAELVESHRSASAATD